MPRDENRHVGNIIYNNWTFWKLFKFGIETSLNCSRISSRIVLPLLSGEEIVKHKDVGV